MKNRLSESEAEAEELTPIAKRESVHCDGFSLPLLLSTPTIWFSLDHKRNVGGGVVSGVGRNGDFVILPIPWLVTARTIQIFVTRSRKQ